MSGYFSHDQNAFQDLKIKVLVDEFGLEAYALYWIFIERMRAEKGYFLSCDKITLRGIKSDSRTTLDIEAFVEFCIEIELFIEDEGTIYSKSLVDRMTYMDNEAEQKSEQARAAVNARWAKVRAEKESKAKKKKGNTPEPKNKSNVQKQDAQECDSNAVSYGSNTDVYGSNTDEYGTILTKIETKTKTKLNKDDTDEESARELNLNHEDKKQPEEDAIDPARKEVFDIYLAEINPLAGRIEYETIDGWLNKGLEPELIIEGIKAAVFAGAPHMNYLRAIMNRCLKHDIKTADQYKKDADYEKRKAVQDRWRKSGGRPRGDPEKRTYQDTGTNEQLEQAMRKAQQKAGAGP